MPRYHVWAWASLWICLPSNVCTCEWGRTRKEETWTCWRQLACCYYCSLVGILWIVVLLGCIGKLKRPILNQTRCFERRLAGRKRMRRRLLLLLRWRWRWRLFQREQESNKNDNLTIHLLPLFSNQEATSRIWEWETGDKKQERRQQAIREREREGEKEIWSSQTKEE